MNKESQFRQVIELAVNYLPDAETTNARIYRSE
jgi:hypothetical protein